MKKNQSVYRSAIFFIATFLVTTAMAQPPGGFGGAPANLPTEPTVAALPDISANTGSGPAFESSAGQWPGYDMAHYDYEINEYVISGTADGEAYKTRLVIRQPADDSRFSGLVVAEAMHPAGYAHAFQHNSV